MAEEERGAFRREVALLWRHVEEVWKEKQKIGGALAVLAILAASAWALPGTLASIRPLLAPALVPWISPHRLTVVGVICLAFFAQYLASRRLRLRLDDLEKELRWQKVLNGQLASRALVEVQYGKSTMLSPRARLDATLARLDTVEHEIQSGDFGHSGEVAALHDVFLELYREHFGASREYGRQRERIAAMLQLMLDHELCLPSDLLAPYPAGIDPLSGRPWRTE